MSSAATTLLSAVTLSTLTDHLVVDTSLRIPTAKWAQTDDALSLEIKTACIGDTKRIAFQHDVFNFTCVSRHAGAEHGYALSLKLREDVSAARCAPTRQQTELCKLTKLEPHEFDRLLEDDGAYRSHIKFDWQRGGEDIQAQAPPVRHPGLSDGTVHELRGYEALAEAVDAHDVVVADVAYPWCSACDGYGGSMQEGFYATAAALKDRDGVDAHFVFMDARENKEVARYLNKKCGMMEGLKAESSSPLPEGQMAPMMNMVNANECKFHVFKKGAPKPYPIMMHQVTEPAAFEAELNRYLGPLVTELGAADDGDAWLAPSKAFPSSTVAVLAELEHNRTVAAKTVNAAAAGLRAWYGTPRVAVRYRRPPPDEPLEPGAPCGCAADGVSGGVDTGRRGCADHVGDGTICYVGGGAGEVVGEGCVQAFTSGAFPGAGWRRCDPAREGEWAAAAAAGTLVVPAPPPPTPVEPEVLTVRRAAGGGQRQTIALDGLGWTQVHLALHTSAFEAIEETLVNARSSGEHEPEELRMKREMLEAMTLPVVRVYTAYELVPNELDTVKQVAEKLRGKVIFTLHRIATYATAKLLLDVGLDPSSPPALAGYASAKEKDLVKGYPYKGDIADAMALTMWCNALYATVKAEVEGGAAEGGAKLLAPGVRSQVRMAPLDEWKPGAVQEYVTADVSEGVFGGERDTLVVFHRPADAAPTSAVASVLARTARVLGDGGVDGVVVARFSPTENSFDSARFGGLAADFNGVAAFVCAAKPDCTLRRHKGALSLKSLLAFLKKHSPAVKERWTELVRAAEALASEERAAKELAKEQAAADAAAAEAKQAILDGGAKQKVIEGGPNELEEMWEKEEL